MTAIELTEKIAHAERLREQYRRAGNSKGRKFASLQARKLRQQLAQLEARP